MNQLRGLTGEDLAQSGAVNGAAHAGVEVAVKVLLRVDAGDTPIATQIDGEYLGLRTSMTFRAVPDALSVVAPPAKILC